MQVEDPEELLPGESTLRDKAKDPILSEKKERERKDTIFSRRIFELHTQSRQVKETLISNHK